MEAVVRELFDNLIILLQEIKNQESDGRETKIQAK